MLKPSRIFSYKYKNKVNGVLKFGTQQINQNVMYVKVCYFFYFDIKQSKQCL